MKLYHILILSFASLIACTSSESSIKRDQLKSSNKIADEDKTEYLTKDNRLVKIHYENDQMISQRIMDPITKETLRYLRFHRDGLTIAHEYLKIDALEECHIMYKTNGEFSQAILRKLDGSKIVIKDHEKYKRTLASYNK